MRCLVTILFIVFALPAFSQRFDTTGFREVRISEPDKPDQKKSRVIISSPPGSSYEPGSWEEKWSQYVEKQALVIAEKQLRRDTTRRIYKVVIEFSINPDQTLNGLKVSCVPSNSFIEEECRQMALNAPKKAPVYRNGSYVRPRIYQPVDIRIKGPANF